MEFLVNIDVALPSGMPSDRRQELYAAEAVQAASLAAAGRLIRLWRIPGRTANWGLWLAADAT
jgi:muconolactone D-isomerase